jgi:hypothetical protein
MTDYGKDRRIQATHGNCHRHFLGFMLNFSTTWIKEAFTKYMFRDIRSHQHHCMSIFIIDGIVPHAENDYLSSPKSFTVGRCACF